MNTAAAQPGGDAAALVPFRPDHHDNGATTVWVSGSEGKLGREVVSLLGRAGHQIIEADSRGTAAVDLTDPSAVAHSMQGADAIVHCAAIPSPEGVDPAELMRNNTMACFNALEQAWSAGVRTAVLASSGSIYGTAWSPEPLTFPEAPVSEETPLAYTDPYALSKDVTERMGQMYARRGMVVTALRFHWILSPEEANAEARSGNDGDPSALANLWGYVDLEDAARACLLALTPTAEHSGYEAVLIASHETLSRTPTEELLAQHCPETLRRHTFTGHEGAFDTSRAAAVLGWRSTRSWR